ncbi:hypothetical protein CATMIT_01820, partial [Catenibacterium mitsuokai DSM 15897]
MEFSGILLCLLIRTNHSGDVIGKRLMELSASLHNYQAMDGRIVRAIANQVVVLPSLVGADYERIRG